VNDTLAVFSHDQDYTMNRRNFILSSIFIACASIAPSLASAEPLFINDTNDGFLNLRTGPGTNYPILTRLYGGTEVDGVGQSGSWRRVLLPDGQTGWASGNFMSPRYTQQRHYDAIVARTSDGYLNMRSGPGTNYRIIQRLYAGQGVNDTGSNGNWLRVQLADGSTGWVSSRYLN
jgi:N-acetylmuramoyl-L-alanine amidase